MSNIELYSKFKPKEYLGKREQEYSRYFNNSKGKHIQQRKDYYANLTKERVKQSGCLEPAILEGRPDELLPIEDAYDLNITRFRKFAYGAILKDLIPRPPLPECILHIAIPAYEENIGTVKKQLESIENQVGVDFKSFEVIYLINNSPEIKQETRRINQETIKFITNYNAPFPIHVIDNSSVGREIHGCNVGQARNRLLQQISFRAGFNQQNSDRNSIILQTDADTTLPEHYIKTALEQFENSQIAASSNGRRYVPDEELTGDAENLIKTLMLVTKNKVADWVQNGTYLNYSLAQLESRMVGPNMLSTVDSALAVLGIINANAKEDTTFGRDLYTLCRQVGNIYATALPHLLVNNTLRISGRTSSGFEKFLNTDDIENHSIPSLVQELSALFCCINQNQTMRMVNSDSYKFLIELLKNNGYDDLLQSLELANQPT